MNKPGYSRKVSAKARIKGKPFERVKLSQEELSVIRKQNRSHGKGHKPSAATALGRSDTFMRNRASVLRTASQNAERDKERALLESTSLGDLIK